MTAISLHDSIYERLLRDRIIYLGTEVTDEVANWWTMSTAGASSKAV